MIIARIVDVRARWFDLGIMRGHTIKINNNYIVNIIDLQYT